MAIILIIVCYFKRKSIDRGSQKGRYSGRSSNKKNKWNQQMALSTVSERSEALEYSVYSKKTIGESRVMSANSIG